MRDEDRKGMWSSSCLDRLPQQLLDSTLILNNYLIICMKRFSLSIKTGSHKKHCFVKSWMPKLFNLRRQQRANMVETAAIKGLDLTASASAPASLSTTKTEDSNEPLIGRSGSET